MRDQAERWANFVLANLLWVLFALPIITLPAATAGVFAIMSGQVRGKSKPFFEAYFGAMRRLWLKATAIVLLDLLVGGLIVFNMLIFERMAALDLIGFLARSVTLFAGIALALTNLYVWPLMVSAELSLRQLISTSITLMFAYPLRSLLVLILGVFPLSISFWLPRGVFLLVTVSSMALMMTMGTWPVIERHVPDEALVNV